LPVPIVDQYDCAKAGVPDNDAAITAPAKILRIRLFSKLSIYIAAARSRPNCLRRRQRRSGPADGNAQYEANK
jgi:hypothetical protein